MSILIKLGLSLYAQRVLETIQKRVFLYSKLENEIGNDIRTPK